jgi:hypothetical protein
MVSTNLSTAHPQPSAAAVTGSAARTGNSRAHNRQLHTAPVASPEFGAGAVAAAAAVEAVAAIAGVEPVAVVVAEAGLVEEPVAEAGLVEEPVVVARHPAWGREDSAMHQRAAQAVI